jgi:hypothetical protein
MGRTGGSMLISGMLFSEDEFERRSCAALAGVGPDVLREDASDGERGRR